MKCYRFLFVTAELDKISNALESDDSGVDTSRNPLESGVDEDGECREQNASKLPSFSFSEVGKISPRASSAPLKQHLGQANQPRAPAMRKGNKMPP